MTRMLPCTICSADTERPATRTFARLRGVRQRYGMPRDSPGPYWMHHFSPCSYPLGSDAISSRAQWTSMK